MVARSRSHSSPGCVPRGVILTFCAHTGAPAADNASANILIPKCFIFMTSSPGKQLRFFKTFSHVGRSIGAGHDRQSTLPPDVFTTGTHFVRRFFISDTRVCGSLWMG